MLADHLRPDPARLARLRTMSREERRNYERQMRSMERGPALPPAAKARAERNAARRAARATPERSGGFTPRFWIVTSLAALAAGYFAFSIQFQNMPFAIYLGVIVAAIVAAVLVGLRLLQRRTGPR